MKPIEKIISLGVVFYAADKKTLLSSRRDAHTARIRFSIMGALRAEGYTLTTIGEAFNRDHGSVINGLANLNPANMADLWGRHEQFLLLVKSRADLDDEPITDVISSIKLAIDDVESKIASLGRTRDTLSNTLKALEASDGAQHPTIIDQCSMNGATQ